MVGRKVALKLVSFCTFSFSPSSYLGARVEADSYMSGHIEADSYMTAHFLPFYLSRCST